MTASPWSVNFGDVESDLVDGSTVDGAGNAYVSVRYQGNIDVAPAESFADDRDLLSALPGERGLAIVKYDPSGGLEWVHSIDTDATVPGLGSGFIKDLDVANGNVYFFGSHIGMLDFDGAGTDPLAVIDQTSTTEYGGFVGRLDAQDGRFDWVKESGQGFRGSAHSFAVDELGNSHFAISNALDEPTFFDGLLVPNEGGYQATVVSLDTNGQLQNVQTLNSLSYFTNIRMDVDDSASNPSDWNLIVGGQHRGDLQFSSGTLITKANYDEDAFLASLDSDGAVQWINRYDIDGVQSMAHVTVNDQGDIFFNGINASTTETMVFANVSGGTLNNMAQRQYLVQVDSDGSFKRGAAIGTPKPSDGRNSTSIAALQPTESGVLIAGSFRETSTIADATLTSAGSGDGFVMLLSSDLTSSLWHQQIGSTGSDRILQASISADGRIGLGGDFRETVELLTGEVVTSAGRLDGFFSSIDLPVTTPPIDPPVTGPVTLLEDSFETGSSKNDWDSKWVEDSQNDFFRSTQRASEGNRSAEVDGYANNATLTLAQAIDISGYDTVELKFDWLIERGFDRGEYLALDISTDGGGSWVNDVRRLNGNQDAENIWHNESVDLGNFTTNDLLIRFRSKVSRSREDANVDNVQVIGSNQNSGEEFGSQAVAGLTHQKTLGSIPNVSPAAASQFGEPQHDDLAGRLTVSNQSGISPQMAAHPTSSTGKTSAALDSVFATETTFATDRFDDLDLSIELLF